MEYKVVASKAGGAFRVDFEKSAEVLSERVSAHLAKGGYRRAVCASSPVRAAKKVCCRRCRARAVSE